MPREIKTKIYQFKELSSEIQAKVLEDHRHVLVQHDDWFEFIIDDFIVDMDDKGHTICAETINFGDFYSQGAGACFTTGNNGDLDIQSLLKDLGIKMKDLPKGFGRELREGLMTIEINRFTYQYNHEHTVTIDLTYDGENTKIEDAFFNMNPLFDNLLRGKMKKLNEKLQNEYERLTSLDEVIEEIESQDLEFYEDGKVFSE